MLKFVVAIICVGLLVLTVLCIIGACRVDSISTELTSLLKEYNDDINIIKSLIKENNKERMDARLKSTHYMAKDQSEKLLLLAVDKNNLERRLQYLHNKIKCVRNTQLSINTYIGTGLISFIIFLVLASYGGTL